MSVGTKLLQAAAGNAGEVVYVDDVFSTFLYTGTQSTLAINNAIDLSGEGGLTWFKCRNVAMLHNLFDTERGNTQRLDSSGTGAQSAQASGRYPTFTSTGFTLGADDGGDINYSGRQYVSWTFRKQEKFFDIVTYTGNGTAGRTISHNLGSVPGMMIVKSTSNGEAWEVYHRKADATAPEDKYLQLNGTGSVGDSSFRWNDTAPTATEFTVGGANEVNGNGMTYVAYLFAHNEQDFGENSDEAIIHCGSYNSTGLVNLGFEPQFILSRCATTNANWKINDMMRGIAGGATSMGAYLTNTLAPNTSAAEENSTMDLTLEPNGFNVHSLQDGAGTYIYMAIARPHKPASEFAATDLFEPVEYTGNGVTGRQIGSTVSPDSYIMTSTNTEDTLYPMWGSKLQGNATRLTTSRTDAEYSSTSYNYSFGEFHKGIYARGSDVNGSGEDYITYLLRRAKGYFDVVAYEGNGVNGRTVTHSLGVVPELYIVKRRSSTGSWYVYSSATGNQGALRINATSAVDSASALWNSTSPTASVFTVSSNQNLNASTNKYIAYLFATVDGISKVGSYTGTGSNLNVDCGFSAGARFVLIKRTDSSGDWYVWDSVRGIVAGNDPYFLLNNDANEVTNTDYIDPLNAGFTVTSSAPAALNNSGGNYIFLAIA